MNAGELAGKNVVIIGGTAGIGLATAEIAAAKGGNVWVTGRTAANLETAQGVSQGRFKVLKADIHNATELEAVYQEAGQIDHLVCAAIGGERTLKPFLEQTQDQFQAAFQKLWGYCHAVRTASQYLSAEASITFVSGSPARKIRPSQSALSCVGGAVENLARCLAVEMAPVRVNIVSPGTISTGMFDWMGEEKEQKLSAMTAENLIKRPGLPTEVATGILFVMQNEFVTGTTVDVDGGRILS